jgi:DNA helicase-2/ATP-dependent DNA helicase PcrA
MRRKSSRPRIQRPRKQSDPLEIPREEEVLCRRVVDHLRNLRPSRPPPRGGDDEALVTLRDQIADSRLEDVPALIQQMEQVSAVASRRGMGTAEPVDPKSPYFGHLRVEEAERGTRDVLIGKTTHIDPRANIRIVDWRHAPISQLYYRYDEGAQYEETFGDREVEGTVLARRTVTIVDGELRRVSSPHGTFVRSVEGWRQATEHAALLSGGEGSAVRAEQLRGRLGTGGHFEQREDRHLPEIAALLDPRQFEIIARPDSGLIIVQGGAGSGKTTIGVHRMAYLTYQSPARFSAPNMLVVVGTPALRDYIGGLLDALGLGVVRVVTFAWWARRARENAFAWLKPPIEDNTPAEVSRLKTAPAVLRLLERRARELRNKGRTGVRDALWLWAEVLTDRQALERAFASASQSEARLSPEQLERAWRYCADRCPAIVDWRAPEPESDDEEIEGADGVIEQQDERAALDPEDDALLLRSYQLVHGPLRYKRQALRYEHLFVDEAQDLAAVDLCVLADIVSSGKSITLAGDTAQRLNVDTGFRNWREVVDALAPVLDKARARGAEPVAMEPLRIAYRSTRQVMTFARAVLGPLADDEEPDAPRVGAPVELYELPSQGAAAAFLADALRPLFRREPRATVAILARYAEQADAYYEVLHMAEVPNLRRVRSYDFAFRPGVEVTEIRQVKGLEYDYVVLVDVNASSFPMDDEARYQLHIAATRAAHQLWIVSTGTPSPLLPEWLERG